MLQNNQETIFIIDEAYGRLDYNFESSVSLIKQYENLIVLHSFTKAYAIPGIRLGYVLASTSVIKKLLQFKIPWSVNSLAIEAGIAIIKEKDEFAPTSEVLKRVNQHFFRMLSLVNGFEVFPSGSNYFLIRLKKGSAPKLKKFFIERFGILIRDASNFRGLDESYFRVSVQDESKNELLVKALKSYFDGIY